MTLQDDRGLKVDAVVKTPRASATPRAAIVTLGGPEGGVHALDDIEDTGDFTVLAMDYPYKGQRSGLSWWEFLRHVPDMRRAVPDTPSATMLGVDYLFRRPDVDRKRIVLIGGSLGALFAPAVAAADLDGESTGRATDSNPRENLEQGVREAKANLNFGSVLASSEDPGRLPDFYKKVLQKGHACSESGYDGFKAGNGVITFGPLLARDAVGSRLSRTAAETGGQTARPIHGGQQPVSRSASRNARSRNEFNAFSHPDDPAPAPNPGAVPRSVLDRGRRCLRLRSSALRSSPPAGHSGCGAPFDRSSQSGCRRDRERFGDGVVAPSAKGGDAAPTWMNPRWNSGVLTLESMAATDPEGEGRWERGW